MWRNHLKITLRNFLKHKLHSGINLLGLTVGLAACIFIFLFVQDEWKYDAFHPDTAQLYRITTIETDDGITHHVANAYQPVGPLLETAFPGQITPVRLLPQSVTVKNPTTNELFQENKFHFADSLFFEVFNFPFLAGNPTEALRNPKGVVLSESCALRYFGERQGWDEILGQPLLVNQDIDLIIAGVAADPPSNSTIQFDLVAAMPGAAQVLGEWIDQPRRTWYFPPVYTFAVIKDRAFAESWQQKMGDFERNHLSERLSSQYDFQLQPLRDMHFTALESDLQPSIQPALLYVFAGIAILILGIACVNYINLAMARLIHRFREIGMRKILGAQKRHLFQQSWLESALYIGSAFVLAIFLAQMGLPTLNKILGKQLSISDAPNAELWVAMTAGAVLLAGVISLFPFLGLAKFGVAGMLKTHTQANTARTRNFSLKNALIVFQFSTAAGLIIAALVIHGQLRFIQHKNLGLSPDQVMVIPIRWEEMQNDFDAYKNQFTSIPGVKSVSAISNFPWESGFHDFPSTISGQGKSVEANLPTLLVDPDFIQTMGMQMVKGRPFSSERVADAAGAFILNEAAAKKMGVTDLEGLKLEMKGVASGENKAGDLIGVVKDFHLKSLHHSIDPVVLSVTPTPYFLDNFVVRLETDNLAATVSAFSKKWEAVAPDKPFDYFFLDEAFDQLYRRENRMGSIFQMFTLLAILIACLGLFALAAIAAGQRSKEIGIRKVLGATVSSIVSLLSWDFLKLVFIGVAVAAPAAWYFMNGWLKSFAYRIEVEWWVFALALVCTMAIAFFTVSYQSIRAATANPGESLKTD